MMKKTDKISGGAHFLAGYGLQVFIAPALAGILLAIFFWGFGYDADLLWTNVLILAVWLILVLIVFRIQPNGKIWRDYGWIFSPAILVLLLLLNISWARSTQEINALDKSGYIEINIPDTNLILHVIYPQQINYDEQGAATVTLWMTNDDPCIQRNISLSSDDLFFALQPTDGSPLQWQENITTRLPSSNSALLIHVRSRIRNFGNTQEVTLDSAIGGTEIRGLPPILLEGKKDAQVRLWKSTLLDASSISIIIGIVVAWIEIRRKEEEERKRKEGEINNALEEFDETMRSNFSASINNWERLTRNWEEWDWVFQDQVKRKFDMFIESEFWNCIVSVTADELREDIKHFLPLCQRIFENQEDKTTFTLKQLHSALLQDDHASLNLLAMLKEYPASINIAKIIASVFSSDLKKKTIDDYASKFLDQIRDLRVELDFPDLESFPLQRQFSFYTYDHTAEDRLTAWLETHELDCSPFADADSPFYSVSVGQLLIDMVLPGFTFPIFDIQNQVFEFSNSWDAGAGLFEYCNALKSNVRIKNEIFFSIITPSMIENYEMDHARKLYLHALAEQWMWSLAETPTLLYSLQGEQRGLVGRLIRWHDTSPSITVHKIEKFAGRLQEKEKKRPSLPFSALITWLSEKDAADLRAEEINALIELQPYPKRSNLFLVPTIDLNPQVEWQISRTLHEKLVEQFDWLSAHNSKAVIFSVGAKNRQVVALEKLVNQCRIRTRKCSNDKLEFNQLFDASVSEPDNILARKANGSPGRMVRLGQKLLLQHVEKYSPDDKDNYEYLHIEDLEAL